jgi:hypothetical protein
MHGTTGPVRDRLWIIVSPRTIIAGGIVAGVGGEARKTVAEASSHVKPIYTASEASIADSVHATIPLGWQKKSKPEGRGARARNIDRYSAQPWETSGVCGIRRIICGTKSAIGRYAVCK